MKVSFSLSKNTRAKPTQQPPALKKSTAFSALEDDIPHSEASIPESGKLDANKRLAAQNVSAEMSKATKKRMAAEMQVDATVFEYDEVYDKMQEAKAKQKEMKEVDAKERKVSCSRMLYTQQQFLIRNYQPKYINSLLNSAATRRLDYLRAEEKMIQREREAEGDEFKDKDAFVTQAYKDQMAELRRAEQEEKERDGMGFHFLPLIQF